MDTLYGWNNSTKYGIGCCVVGSVLFILGVLLLFDRALLTLGNVLFTAGIFLIMGPHRFWAFFIAKKRVRASVLYFSGILLVVLRWCCIGIILQGFGALNLFGNFIPIALTALRNIPIIGPILSHPTIAPSLNKIAGLSSKSNSYI